MDLEQYSETYRDAQYIWPQFVVPCLYYNLVRTIDTLYANIFKEKSKGLDDIYVRDLCASYRTIITDMLMYKQYNESLIFEKQLKEIDQVSHADVVEPHGKFGVDILYPLLLASTLNMKGLLRAATYSVQTCSKLDTVFQASFQSTRYVTAMIRCMTIPSSTQCSGTARTSRRA